MQTSFYKGYTNGFASNVMALQHLLFYISTVHVMKIYIKYIFETNVCKDF